MQSEVGTYYDEILLFFILFYFIFWGGGLNWPTSNLPDFRKKSLL